MRVLVTGGAGFIGREFVRQSLLSQMDWELVAVDSLTYASRPEEFPSGPKSTLIQGDICEPAAWDRRIGKVDLVVNFAAESHVDNSIHSADRFIRSNILGVASMVDYCLEKDLRLHQVSTDEVFGDMSNSQAGVATESSPYRPSNPYSASKAAGDLLILAAVRTHGLRATISYGSNTYGPGQHREKLIPKLANQVLDGIPMTLYGDGTQVRDWITASDHCKGILACILEGREGETYCLPGNNLITNRELALKIAETLGRPDHDIDFVTDRPGHDKKYEMSGIKAFKELSWRPESSGVNLDYLGDF